MASNNEYDYSKCKVLKIPFASKRVISKIVRENKLTKYDFTGVAYYLFDSNMNIVNNKAELTYVRNYADKSECDSKWSKRESSIKRNELFDRNELNLKTLNQIIVDYDLTVLDSFSLVTGFTAKGACIGSNFNDTQIIYYDNSGLNTKYNGWRFTTALGTGWKNAERKLQMGDKELAYKYKKTKNNKKQRLDFTTIKSLEEIKLSTLIDNNEEIKRLLLIYNMDLLPEDEWLEYKEEIDYLKEKKNPYPKRKDLETIVAGLILKQINIVNDKKSLEMFTRIVSSHRRDFRVAMEEEYGLGSKEKILDMHEVEKVCEAAHFFDVKYIKKEIIDNIINNKNISEETDKLNMIIKYLDEIADIGNGMFMDPTTHKYFDKNLLVINHETGEITDYTETETYNGRTVNLNEKQRKYLEKRNEVRGNVFN